LSIIFSGNILL